MCWGIFFVEYIKIDIVRYLFKESIIENDFWYVLRKILLRLNDVIFVKDLM